MPYQVHLGEYLTSDQTLITNKDYQKVSKVMDSVIASGAVALGAGSCIGMCRLIYAALKNEGIHSKLVECQLTYTRQAGLADEQTNYIGFDDIKNPGEIDTHVVIITETEIPLLIDASLPHRLGGVIIEKVSRLETDGTFSDFIIKDKYLKCLYQRKLSQKIPLVEQISFIDRMETDKKIFGNLKFLRTLIAIALTVSSLNALRGFYDHYYKYLDESSYWGPDAIQRLDHKLDTLNEVVRSHLRENIDHKK